MLPQATAKQTNFIHLLQNQAKNLGIDLFNEMDGRNWERMWDLDAGIDADGESIKYVSITEASDVITELLGLIDVAKRNQPKQLQLKVHLQPGIYRKGDQFYKVQWNKKKTNTYAKRMEIFGGNRLTDDGEVVHFKWIYEDYLISKAGLTAEYFLPVEEVGNLGLKYGNCMICGRKLVDAYSVMHGIGPVCAKNYGTEAMVE